MIRKLYFLFLDGDWIWRDARHCEIGDGRGRTWRDGGAVWAGSVN